MKAMSSVLEKVSSSSIDLTYIQRHLESSNLRESLRFKSKRGLLRQRETQLENQAKTKFNTTWQPLESPFEGLSIGIPQQGINTAQPAASRETKNISTRWGM